MDVEQVATNIESILDSEPPNTMVAVWPDGTIATRRALAPSGVTAKRRGRPAFSTQRGRITRLRLVERLRLLEAEASGRPRSP